MDYREVIKYQEDLAKKYKYKPIPFMFREETLKFYKDNLPEHFSLEGGNEPLFTTEGLKICNRYNRIVIGDYGAFVEILPDDMIHENIKIKEGQEYRDYDERYSKSVKYSWLTSKDGSDIKICFQKKRVEYADYVPGRYYISPYECSFLRVLEKNESFPVSRDKIAIWLQKQGVFTLELFEYYISLSDNYGKILNDIIENDLSPANFEFWIKLNELCNLENGLSFEQFMNVKYNLYLIDCKREELTGPFSKLKEDVKTAIQMGLEEFAIPHEAQKLNVDLIRSLLNMSVDNLLDVMHLSKIIAGCKGEYTKADVDSIIEAAEERAQDVSIESKNNDVLLEV